jgi:hypothetical protein
MNLLEQGFWMTYVLFSDKLMCISFNSSAYLFINFKTECMLIAMFKLLTLKTYASANDAVMNQ